MNGLLLIVFSAALTGFGSGLVWRWGNSLVEQGVPWLILLAVPSNLVVALAVYFAVRGAASLGEDAVGMFVLLSVVHLVILLAVAATTAGVVGSGTSRIGAHVFSWGASYGYGQALQDVRAGKWLGD